MDCGQEVTITAQYMGTIYDSDGFRIMRFAAQGQEKMIPMALLRKGDALFTAKGNVSLPDYDNQIVKITGEWTQDPKYGIGLTANYLVPVPPATVVDLKNLLVSIHGIGEVLSSRLCDEYGLSILEMCHDEYVLAASVRKLTVSKAASICAVVKRINVTAEVGLLLKGVVPPAVVGDIVKKYGSESMGMVMFKPYQMAEDSIVSFSDADAIAIHQGGDKENEERLQVAAMLAMRYLRVKLSSAVVPKEMLLFEMAKMLGLPEDFIAEYCKKLYESRRLISAGVFVYLYSDFNAEVNLVNQSLSFEESLVPTKDRDMFLAAAKAWCEGHKEITLAREQYLALKSVAYTKLLVVTGNPGTGKTTFLKAVMETYRDVFPQSNILLMAPTGLAAKRLAFSCNWETCTLHKGLGLGPSSSDEGFIPIENVKIDGGLVIVDEASMIGLQLMAALFDAIEDREDTRIVFVGDANQLSSVSPGAPFKAFLKSGIIPVIQLRTNFRQQAGSRIAFAQGVIEQGRHDLEFANDLRFIEISHNDIENETYAIQEQLTARFAEYVNIYGADQTIVVTPKSRVRYNNDGTPTAYTRLSAAALNPILRDIANPPGFNKREYKHGKRVFREGDRVMNLANEGNIANGDMAIIEKIEIGSEVVFHLRFDDHVERFAPDKLKNIVFAYSVTAHKVQGSEFDCVLLPVSRAHAPMLQRNIFYTALTRGKEQVILIGDRRALNEAIDTVDMSLKDLLCARLIRTKQLGAAS